MEGHLQESQPPRRHAIRRPCEGQARVALPSCRAIVERRVPPRAFARHGCTSPLPRETGNCTIDGSLQEFCAVTQRPDAAEGLYARFLSPDPRARRSSCCGSRSRVVSRCRHRG